ncbi:MAG: peptidase S41, partial [Candidatus Omnitrophica bacterium]|nr:peptidase S41 [Candidatus Omnitrophota bacterium]
MFLRNKIAFLLIVLCACLLFFAGPILSENKVDKSVKDEMYQELGLFADGISIVQSQYVDETKPKDLVYGALKGMLSALDPYSEFLTP